MLNETHKELILMQKSKEKSKKKSSNIEKEINYKHNYEYDIQSFNGLPPSKRGQNVRDNLKKAVHFDKTIYEQLDHNKSKRHDKDRDSDNQSNRHPASQSAGQHNSQTGHRSNRQTHNMPDSSRHTTWQTRTHKGGLGDNPSSLDEDEHRKTP